MLDLLCYSLGGYGEGCAMVFCFPVIFRSSLYLREGGGRLLQVRCLVGFILEPLGMMAFSLAPVV